MGALRTLRVWASVGVLLLAAGMPYCAAAIGCCVTQDETSISIRADVAAGVLVASVGWTILMVVAVIWIAQRLRPARPGGASFARARGRSRG